jgi:putative Mn2+ efflux pump MntP
MTLILLAFAVAMDCTAVAAAYALRRIPAVDILKLAVTFGSFQAGTLLIGALGGTAISSRLGAWDGFIAFVLLLVVGSHMIHEGLFEDDDEEERAPNLSLTAVLLLGIATSIDSLAVGATIPALGLAIVLSASVVGLVSFAMSSAGAWIAVRAGERFGPYAEIVGGIVLIAIGARALVVELGT